ncbi:MAG: hypothetical protein ACOC16_01555 [Nanoarchaeota archaeon]
MKFFKEKIFNRIEFIVLVLVFMFSLSAVSYMSSNEIFDAQITYVNDQKFPFSIILKVDNLINESLSYDIKVIYKKANLEVGSLEFVCNDSCEEKIELSKVFFDNYDVFVRAQKDGKFYDQEINFNIEKAKGSNKIFMDNNFFVDKNNFVNISGKLFLSESSQAIIEAQHVDEEKIKFKKMIDCEEICDFNLQMNSTIIFGQYDFRVYLPNDVLKKEIFIRLKSDNEKKNNLSKNDENKKFVRYDMNKIPKDSIKDNNFVTVIDIIGNEREIEIINDSILIPKSYSIKTRDENFNNDRKKQSEKNNVSKLKIKNIESLKELDDFKKNVTVKKKGFTKMESFSNSLDVQSLSRDFNKQVSVQEKIYIGSTQKYIEVNDKNRLILLMKNGIFTIFLYYQMMIFLLVHIF